MSERARAGAVVELESAPFLQPHFDSPAQQLESGKLGMWLFLAQELLFFGGLFCAYTIYRAHDPELFRYGSSLLSWKLGGLNTLVLIGSSLTMAWGVRSAQLGQRKLLLAALILTQAFAGTFLVVKYFEYGSKFEHGLLWGRHYQPDAHYLAAHGYAAAGSFGADLAAGDDSAAHAEPTGLRPAPTRGHQFFGIYFVMTGLHLLHVVAGMGAIGWLMLGAWRGIYGPAFFNPVDVVGLYWHLVDLIWIFLFPQLYLI